MIGISKATDSCSINGDGYDPDGFGRRVRELAVEARGIMSDPDRPIDDVIHLHSRVHDLLCEASGPRSTEVYRWLMAIRRHIAHRLQLWAMTELDAVVS
jgi:hypothetical protein